MEEALYRKFRSIVYERSGIALGENKKALLCARVGKRMRALGLAEYRAYLRHLMEDPSGTEMVQLIDAVSTNVTSFFREPDHFEFLRDVFLGWVERGQRRFRFWSTACSTGEEPYSMAMTLLDAAKGKPLDIKILATDISTQVLQKCRAATYERQKIEPVPRKLRERFLERSQGQQGNLYTVKPVVKELLVFRQLNLTTPPLPMRGPLDGVFCRNVMIYFDNATRKRVVNEIHRLLKPGGYLMVGHAESLTGLMSDLVTVKPAVYKKK
jgi:chemotaxis protein methyltransferase CheR